MIRVLRRPFSLPYLPNVLVALAWMLYAFFSQQRTAVLLVGLLFVVWLMFIITNMVTAAIGGVKRQRQRVRQLSRAEQMGAFLGLLAALLALLYIYAGQERAIQLDVQFGLTLFFFALVGSWLGRRLLRALTAISLPRVRRPGVPRPTVAISVAPRTIILLLLGVALGAATVLSGQDLTETLTMTFGVQAALWITLVTAVVYRLGNLLLARGGTVLWQLLPAFRSWPIWRTLLGPLFGALFGVSLTVANSPPAPEAAATLPDGVSGTAVITAVIGFFVARWLGRIGAARPRRFLSIALVLAVIIFALLAFTPVGSEAVNSILMAGGTLGTLGALVFVRPGGRELWRAALGALAGAILVFADNTVNLSLLPSIISFFLTLMIAILIMGWLTAK